MRMRDLWEGVPSESVMASADASSFALPAEDSWHGSRVEQLSSILTQVMSGELSRGRPLKYWENLKLKPQHLQMLLMKAAGYTNSFIAEEFKMTGARVSVILNHPDAQHILSILVSYAAEDLLDIKTRVRAHAGEMLDNILHTTRSTKDEKLKSKNSFELLRMAGYGAVEKKEVVHSLQVPSEVARSMTEALRESREVDQLTEIKFVEIPKEPLQLPAGSGHGEQLSGRPKPEPVSQNGRTPSDNQEPPLAVSPRQRRSA